MHMATILTNSYFPGVGSIVIPTIIHPFVDRDPLIMLPIMLCHIAKNLAYYGQIMLTDIEQFPPQFP